MRFLGAMALSLLVGTAPVPPTTPATTPASAPTVATEPRPQLIVPTPDGDILISLAAEEAPAHGLALAAAIDAGSLTTMNVSRAQTDFYVQLSPPPAGDVGLSGLAVEPTKVGNERGAVSIYDGGTPGTTPTLAIFLVDSPQLDGEYTPIGWVAQGLDVVAALARRPTVGDHLPQPPIQIGPVRRVAAGEVIALKAAPVVAQSATSTTRSTNNAAMVMALFAALIALLIFVMQTRLSPAQTSTLLLSAVLVGFFAVWIGLAGNTAARPWIGVALFGGAIGLFKLMGRFERPR